MSGVIKIYTVAGPGDKGRAPHRGGEGERGEREGEGGWEREGEGEREHGPQTALYPSMVGEVWVDANKLVRWRTGPVLGYDGLKLNRITTIKRLKLSAF